MENSKTSTSSPGKVNQDQEGAAGHAVSGTSSDVGGYLGSFQAQAPVDPLFGLFGYTVNGEYMRICPYDKAHRVKQSRWIQHLLKCRHNHELAQREIGEEVIHLSCKYNYRHRIPAHEILLHEASCLDKEKELMGLHFLAMRNQMENTSLATGEESTLEGCSKSNQDDQGAAGGPSTAELSDQLLDLYNKRPNGNFHNEVAKMIEAAKKGKEKAYLALKQAMQQPEEEESYAMTSRRPRRVPTRQALAEAYPFKPKFPEKPGEDETHDEKWWLEGNPHRTPFYWIEHVHNLPAPTLSYPPGLSRAERKKFVEENTTRMALERGHGQVFVPKELRPKPKPEDIVDLTKFMKKKP